MLIRNLRISRLAGVALAGLLLAGPARAGFEENVFTAGHADVGVAYEGGDSFFLHYHFGPGAVVNGAGLPGGLPPEAYEFDPSTVTTFFPIGPNTSGPRPGGAQWDFIGTAAGNTFFFLSQNNIAGLPFLGWAVTEDLNPNEWSGPITWTLTGVNGPGQFSVYQTSLFGTPNAFMSTADGLPDSMTVPAGVHDHFNLAFTAPGSYDVTLSASGTTTTGINVTGSATFRFQVGPLDEQPPPPVTSAPEPSSLALIGMGLGGALFARSWRRKKAAPASAS